MEYSVRWEIDVQADNPVEAAREAERLFKAPDSTARVFEVFSRSDRITTVGIGTQRIVCAGPFSERIEIIRGTRTVVDLCDH